jgi:Flp pilus assembly protein TadG
MLRRLAAERRGSLFVELALVLPILVLILAGTMVMGIVINAKIVVAGAAREGARTWAIDKADGRAREKAANAIDGGGLPRHDPHGRTLFDPNHDVTFEQNAGGSYITVTVKYHQPIFVSMIGELFGFGKNPDGLLELQSKAIFRVER